MGGKHESCDPIRMDQLIDLLSPLLRGTVTVKHHDYGKDGEYLHLLDRHIHLEAQRDTPEYDLWLIAIDRRESFNKTSQCPVFFWVEAGKPCCHINRISSAIKLLRTSRGRKASESFAFELFPEDLAIWRRDQYYSKLRAFKRKG